MSTTIDIHILQTVPPSNINRDDTGSPKTAYYGGVRRARVSSQAWKRATRTAFTGAINTSDLGVRTKRVVELVATEIALQQPDLTDRALVLAGKVINAAGIKTVTPKTKKGEQPSPDESGYLLFLSTHQVQRLAALAIQAETNNVSVTSTDAREAADSEHSVDVALFGRMVADAPDFNVDAAAQVAHALSVHAVDNEFDYFTAVDDRAPEDNSGAGMIGTVEFNSSTLYRYATVNVDGLHQTLGDTTATTRAVQAFLSAFVTSMPTGKQNTFANRTLPDAVIVMVRDGQPINLVGAFEEAVDADAGHGRMGAAAQRLADHAHGVDAAYGTTPLEAYVVRVGNATDPLAVLGMASDLPGLITGVGRTVAARLTGS